MADAPHEDAAKGQKRHDTGSTHRYSRTGRPPTHSLTTLRKAVTRLSTRRLDGRSGVAVAARRFKAELTADLGGDPSRAQATLIELAARTWIIVEALDDWLMRQPTLVLHRKRAVVPVLLQRQQLADSLARLLERLGLERRARDVPDLATYVAQRTSETGPGSAQGRQNRAAEGDAPGPARPVPPRDPEGRS